MTPASKFDTMHEPKHLGHVLWDVPQPLDLNLVTVNDFMSLRVARAGAHHIVQRHLCLRGEPYRGADCKDHGLSFRNDTGQCGFESAYESQSHLIESEAKLCGPKPRDDLALDPVGLYHRDFATLDICPPDGGRQ
jgi:hypothetical protein